MKPQGARICVAILEAYSASICPATKTQWQKHNCKNNGNILFCFGVDPAEGATMQFRHTCVLLNSYHTWHPVPDPIADSARRPIPCPPSLAHPRNPRPCGTRCTVVVNASTPARGRLVLSSPKLKLEELDDIDPPIALLSIMKIHDMG